MQLLHCNAARYGAWPSPGRQITRVVSRAPLVRANKEDGGTVDPDSNKTQEELVDILNLEVAKAKVREDISKDLEQRKESLRKIGEELTEAFAKEIELDKMRMDLASSSSLADTLAQFKELDDEVQKIRDELKADQQDLADFEARSSSARNQGLFFKGLYKPEVTGGTDGEGGSTAGGAGTSKGDGPPAVDPEVAKQLRGHITQPACEELASPLRLYVFTYLAVVLGGVIIMDVGGGSPNAPLDVLYGVLAAGMAYTAAGERAALVAQGAAAAAEQAQAADQGAREGDKGQGGDGEGQGS